MGRAEAWKFCSRRSKAERQHERRHVQLWDAAITKKTQDRSYLGLSHLLPLLAKVETLAQMDEIFCEWIQRCWENGESLHIVNDALCVSALDMRTVGHSVAFVWRKVEAPNRAPPWTKAIIYPMAMCALTHSNIVFASFLLLGFFGLLRTGELLQLCSADLLFGKDQGSVTLKDTKTGLRNAAQETVAVDDGLTLETLRALIDIKTQQSLDRVLIWFIWTKSAQAFRNEFAHHCKKRRLETASAGHIAYEGAELHIYFSRLGRWSWHF